MIIHADINKDRNYKVGDVVIPLTRDELLALDLLSGDDPYDDANSIYLGYVESMYSTYGGRVCTITHRYGTDNHYSIKEDCGEFSWSSGMFRTDDIVKTICGNSLRVQDLWRLEHE